MPETVTLTIHQDHVDPEFGIVYATVNGEMTPHEMRTLQDALNGYKLVLLPHDAKVGPPV